MSELDILLGATALTESVTDFARLTAPLPTEQLFRSGGFEQIDGERCVFEVVQNDRQLGGVRHIDGQAHNNSLEPSKLVSHGWITVKEKKTINPSRLFHRRGRYNAGLGEFRSNAQAIIADELEDLVSKCRRTREYFCARVIQDNAGVSYGPAAAAFPTNACELAGSLTVDGGLNNAAVTAAWSIESTKLLSDAANNQIPYFLDQMEANGHNVGHAIINRTVAAALFGNIEMQQFLVNQSGLSLEVLKQSLRANASRQGQDGSLDGSVFNGIGAVDKWHIFNHGYENGAGTFTKYYDDTKCVFLAADLRRNMAMYEGDVFIPERNIIGDAASAADLFSVKKGMNAFAYRLNDDVGSIVLVVTDTFYPAIKNNRIIQVATGVTA
jgi:hypothetical protein